VDPVEVLELFNEKAAKLEGSAFTRFAKTQKLGFHFETVDDMVQVYVKGPHQEAVEAFVLTLRFFVQDNEPISLRNIAALYDTLPLPPDFIAQLHDGRTAINGVLDQTSHVSVGGRERTNREVFEVFLWGGLAHANPSKKADFDAWVRDPDLGAMMGLAFNSTLMDLLEFISWVRDHNVIAIEKLRTLGSQ
jgi:hypothetical protein